MKVTIDTPYPPRTFEEFLGWFSVEEDCTSYLEWIRWPDGFVCPECGSTKAWRTERRLWHCQGCQRQSSVTAGIVFEGSRKPLRLWFHVMWLMIAQKTGLIAKNLCDAYGFGSYQTAWSWLQKLRNTMIRAGRERLAGRVEVDETYIDGQKEGARGRGAEGKTLILVAVEGEAKRKLGRVRFRCVTTIDRKTVESFIQTMSKSAQRLSQTACKFMTSSTPPDSITIPILCRQGRKGGGPQKLDNVIGYL